MVPFASPDIVECLTRVSKEIGANLNCVYVKAIKHLLHNSTALFEIRYTFYLQQNVKSIVNYKLKIRVPN